MIAATVPAAEVAAQSPLPRVVSHLPQAGEDLTYDSGEWARIHASVLEAARIRELSISAGHEATTRRRIAAEASATQRHNAMLDAHVRLMGHDVERSRVVTEGGVRALNGHQDASARRHVATTTSVGAVGVAAEQAQAQFVAGFLETMTEATRQVGEVQKEAVRAAVSVAAAVLTGGVSALPSAAAGSGSQPAGKATPQVSPRASRSPAVNPSSAGATTPVPLSFGPVEPESRRDLASFAPPVTAPEESPTIAQMAKDMLRTEYECLPSTLGLLASCPAVAVPPFTVPAALACGASTVENMRCRWNSSRPPSNTPTLPPR